MIRPFINFDYEKLSQYQSYLDDNDIDTIENYLVENKTLILDSLLDIYIESDVVHPRVATVNPQKFKSVKL